MEGSVLSFLKAKWKVSDTGSVHWASSFVIGLMWLGIERNIYLIHGRITFYIPESIANVQEVFQILLLN